MSSYALRALRAGALALALALVPAVVGAAAPDGDPAGVVNLNTATAEELMALPGIGEAKARAIVDARDARGGFRSVDELVEVKGIGPAGFEKLRPHLVLEGQTTLRP